MEIMFHKIIAANTTLLKIHSFEIVNAINRIKDIIGFRRALKVFAISREQFYYWKKNVVCNNSPLDLCRKIYYNQLTTFEINTIKNYLSNPMFLHWPIISVYYQMLRDKAAFMGLSTFYKYAKLLGLNSLHKPIKKKRYATGIRADKVFQVLHMDITEVRCQDNTKVYLSLIVDNFSRAILGWKASLNKTSAFVLGNLKEVIHKYKLNKQEFVVDLLVDDGSENKGNVDDFLKNPEINIRKIIALIDVYFSNSILYQLNTKTTDKFFIFSSFSSLKI